MTDQAKLVRVGVVAAVGVAIASLIHLLKEPEEIQEKKQAVEQLCSEVELVKKSSKTLSYLSNSRVIKQGNGVLMVRDVPPGDTLLTELLMMSGLAAEFQKVSNLIIDLELRTCLTIKNPITQYGTKRKREEPYMNPQALTTPGTFVMNNARVYSGQLLFFSKKWLRAGPRENIFFHPSDVRAGIITCGGLAPGINTLIRELVVCLRQNYKVPTVVGIKYSFKGLLENKLIQLTEENVATIHHQGGNFLGFYRSEVDIEAVITKLDELRINHLYVIGGDGSLRMMECLHAQIKRRKLAIAICIIPKSITNDIPIIDRTFGFETAVEQAQRAIEAAYNESQSHLNGVGIVKVMGRHSGFLAMHSAIAARNAQACLVPQFPFDLQGPHGLLAFIESRMKIGKSSLIIISQGCSQSVRDYNLKTIGTEWDGQPIKEDIAHVIKKQLQGYLSSKNYVSTIKSIDPTYMIRAVAANAYDTKMCCQLAQSSIDGLMCGYTNFVCGHVANKNVMIPVHEMVSGKYSTTIQTQTKDWQRLLATTGQPSFLNESDT